MGDKEKIIKLYNEGLIYDEIAEKTGINKSTLTKRIGRLFQTGELKKRQRNKKKEKLNIVEKMYKEGYKYKDIAKELDTNVGGISYYIGILKRENRISPRELRFPKIVCTEINQKYLNSITYKPLKLELNKCYSFKELNDRREIKETAKSIKFTGKVIKEYKSHYLIDTGKYLECINKNCMMDLIIKESVNNESIKLI